MPVSSVYDWSTGAYIMHEPFVSEPYKHESAVPAALVPDGQLVVAMSI